MVKYCYYMTNYGGQSIPEADWPLYARRAEDQLSRYERIYTVTAPTPGARDDAICAMADTLAYYAEVQNGGGGPVASASIGSVSVSYGGGGRASQVDTSEAAQAREVYKAAAMHLDIYRGVGSC